MLHDLSTQKGRNAYVEAMSNKTETTEKYTINIDVRDAYGNIIKDNMGNKCLMLSYDIESLPRNMEFNLTQLARTLKAFMPDRTINIDAYIYNSISKTYMNMFSYYVDENRFVKH